MSAGDRDEERAEGPAGGHDDPADHDAAWRSIVDNYGDRAVLDESDPTVPVDRDGTDPAPVTGVVLEPEPAPEPAPDPAPDPAPELEEDRYLPPPPPPAPRPRGLRGAAWCGVLLVPLLLLVTAMTQVGPGWTPYVLIAWFLAGFGYLVATMPRGPRDPWDDGAQV